MVCLSRACAVEIRFLNRSRCLFARIETTSDNSPLAAMAVCITADQHSRDLPIRVMEFCRRPTD